MSYTVTVQPTAPPPSYEEACLPKLLPKETQNNEENNLNIRTNAGINTNTRHPGFCQRLLNPLLHCYNEIIQLAIDYRDCCAHCWQSCNDPEYHESVYREYASRYDDDDDLQQDAVFNDESNFNLVIEDVNRDNTVTNIVPEVPSSGIVGKFVYRDEGSPLNNITTNCLNQNDIGQIQAESSTDIEVVFGKGTSESIIQEEVKKNSRPREVASNYEKHSHSGIDSERYCYSDLDSVRSNDRCFDIGTYDYTVKESGGQTHSTMDSARCTNSGMDSGEYSHRANNSGGHTHSTMDSRGHIYSAIDGGGHTYSAMDSGGHTHSTMNSGGHSHSANDIGGHTHTTIDSGGYSHSANYSEGHTHSTTDSGGHTHSAIDSGGHTHSTIDSGSAMDYGSTIDYSSTIDNSSSMDCGGGMDSGGGYD